MEKRLLTLLVVVFSFHISSFGQALNDSIFTIFKEKIESSDFPSFLDDGILFNRTVYAVKTNISKDTLITERIKVIENGYSDPVSDIERRSVAFKDIDFKGTSIDEGEDFYFIIIYTKNRKNLIYYQLIAKTHNDLVVTNKKGFGRFSKQNVGYNDMKELVLLFSNMYK